MMATLQQVDDFSMLKKHLKLPNLEEILLESKSLNILVLGDLQDSDVVDSLTGIKWSFSKEVNRSTITTDNGAKEIVVYRAKKEGIDVTVWNAPSLSFHQEGYVQEIKKILETVDLKLLYLDECMDEDIVKHVTGAFGIKFLSNILIVAPSSVFGNLYQAIERQIDSKFRFLNLYKTALFETANIIIFHPEVHFSYDRWQSEFFFDCVRHLCSQNTKGTFLKINLKRFKHILEGATVSNVPYPVEEQPLTFTVFKESSIPSICVQCLAAKYDGLLLKRRRLLATELQLVEDCSIDEDDDLLLATEPQPPPPEEAEDKSEPVQELTHFYTGTHDLQFGAHGGGAQATPSEGPPTSNQQ